MTVLLLPNKSHATPTRGLRQKSRAFYSEHGSDLRLGCNYSVGLKAVVRSSPADLVSFVDSKRKPRRSSSVDLLFRYTEQVRQRAGLVEMPGQMQFAGRLTQPTENQNVDHRQPSNLLASRPFGSVSSKENRGVTPGAMPTFCKAPSERGTNPLRASLSGTSVTSLRPRR